MIWPARSKPQAVQELSELKAFAEIAGATEDLQAWGHHYYAEKLRQHRYAISQEALRPWFPAEKVINGMFALRQTLWPDLPGSAGRGYLAPGCPFLRRAS